MAQYRCQRKPQPRGGLVTEPTDESEKRGHLKLERFPPVPMESRPKELVFDSLVEEDIEALKQRGYSPVLLRWLPRRNPVEDGKWLARLMQGAAEGTVLLTKDRAEALKYELQVRRLLDHRAPAFNPHAGEIAQDCTDPLARLDWAETPHSFREATTMVDPERVYEFVKAASQHTESEPRAPKKLRRKKNV